MTEQKTSRKSENGARHRHRCAMVPGTRFMARGTETQRKREFFSSLSSFVLLRARSFAVFALALFLASCFMPVDEAGYQPPPGMGTVRIVFDNGARSILPDDWDADDFEAFQFQFTEVSGNATTQNIWKGKGEHSDDILLPDGEYSLIVIAYMDAAVGTPPFSGGGDHQPTLAAAAGVPAANVSVNTTGTNTVSVTLYAYEPSTAAGDGTFAWSITNSGLTAAEMQVYELDGTTPVGSAVNLMDGTGATGTTNAGDGWEGYLTLPANYYYVEFTLTGGSGPSVVRHILHVYQNFTSTYTDTFD